jgi:chromosome segregation ATPase
LLILFYVCEIVQMELNLKKYSSVRFKAKKSHSDLTGLVLHKEYLNKINNLNNELDKLKDDFKTLNRMYQREEVELTRLRAIKYEQDDLYQYYNDEIASLKIKVHKLMDENKRLNTTLVTRDEEIRLLKKDTKNS